MAIHELDNSIYGVVPFVGLVLEGDYTNKIQPQDEIKTTLVNYRVDSLAFNEKINKTTVLVREIVS